MKKSNIPSIIVAVVICTALVFFLLSKCSRSGYYNGASRAGGDTLNIAIEFSPTGMYMRGDSLSGLNYDIVKAILNREGIPSKITPVASYADATEKLSSGLYDILIADAAVIAEAKEDYIFTEPVFIDRQVLVCRNDSISDDFNVISLANDTVWVASDSPFAERVNNLSDEIGDTIIIREVDNVGSEGLLMMVEVGDIDRAVVNRRVAKKMIDNGLTNVRIAGEISFNQFQAWMLNNGNSVLRDSLNSYISTFKETPEYREIINKYL